MIVSLPYRERAALAIIDSALRASELEGTLEAQSLKTWLRQYRGRSQESSKQIAPRSRVGIQADIVRTCMNRMRSRRLSLAGMHYSKVLYDRSASKQVGRTADSLIAFPGAAKRLFMNAPRGTVKVLHCVDAHPRAHNEELLRHFSLGECRAELYPRWLVDRIEREMELADILLVPSRLVKSQMERHGVSASKIALEPYGVDFELFRPTLDGPADLASRSHRPKIIYVGQISRRKGIGFLIKAAEDLAIDIELVGNVFDASLVGSLPSNIAICPPLPHDRLAEKYQKADAFVIPTVEDACSLVALEAAAAGLPVISTGMNGALEILPERIQSVTEAGDVHALRTALLQVSALSDEERVANANASRGGTLRSWALYGDAVRERILQGTVQ